MNEIGNIRSCRDFLDSLRMHTLVTGEKDHISHPFHYRSGGKAMGRNKYNGSLFKQMIVMVFLPCISKIRSRFLYPTESKIVHM